MFREGNGSRMAKGAMKFLRDKIPCIEINPHMLSNEDFGVSVSFEYKKGSDYHHMIKFHGIDKVPGYVSPAPRTTIIRNNNFFSNVANILLQTMTLGRKLSTMGGEGGCCCKVCFSSYSQGRKPLYDP